MNAAHPAAGAPLSGRELDNSTLNVILACFRLFNGYRPTYPLIASKRGNTPPGGKRLWLSSQCFAEVRWQFVHSATSNFFRIHRLIVHAFITV
jgi:hypothetical protein